MKINLPSLKRKSFLQNVLVLMTGAAFAQGLNVLLSPVLSRIFTPVDFALFALYVSVATVFSVIATGRYELAIILPEKDEDAFNIVFLSLVITLVFGAVSFFVVFFLRGALSSMLNTPELLPMLLLVPCSVLTIGIYNPLRFWFNRKKMYRIMSAGRMIQSCGIGVFSISLGVSGRGAEGLIVGYLLGQALPVVFFIFILIRYDKHMLQCLRVSSMKRLAYVHRKFPLVNSMQAFVDTFSVTLSNFMITLFYPVAILGLYDFAIRILKLPATLIGSAVGQVFYQHGAEAHSSGISLNRKIKKITSGLFVIVLPGMAMLIFWGPEIFSFVLGSQWRESGEMASVLAPYISMHFAVAPLTFVPLILNRLGQSFIFSIFGNIVLPVSVFITGYMGLSFTIALYCVSAGMVVYVLCYYFWLLKITGEKK